MNQRLTEEKDIKEIIEKYFQDKSNKEELFAAISLLEEPHRNLQLRKIIFEIWSKQETNASTELKEHEISNMLDDIHENIITEADSRPRNHVRKLILKGLKIAAILFIGVITGLLINNFQKDEPALYTSIAPKGSVSQMVLPDKTTVFLNSGSEIKYVLGDENKQREVYLNGEAWFEVTKNERKPFIVHTPFYDVKVLGTRFNVKAYRNDRETTTTLEDGSVWITSSTNLEMSRNVELVPGEQLVYNSLNKTIEIKNVKTDLYTSWKENKLIFINMNLKDLFIMIERKFGVDIIVADDIVLDYHYDGTIKNESVLEVLDLLKETLPINYKIEGQQIIIQTNKNNTMK